MEKEEDFVLVFLWGLPVEGETSGSGAEVSECSLVFRVGGKYRAQLSKERAVRRLKELDERFSADRHWACTTAFRPLSSFCVFRTVLHPARQIKEKTKPHPQTPPQREGSDMLENLCFRNGMIFIFRDDLVVRVFFQMFAYSFVASKDGQAFGAKSR